MNCSTSGLVLPTGGPKHKENKEKAPVAQREERPPNVQAAGTTRKAPDDATTTHATANDPAVRPQPQSYLPRSTPYGLGQTNKTPEKKQGGFTAADPLRNLHHDHHYSLDDPGLNSSHFKPFTTLTEALNSPHSHPYHTQRFNAWIDKHPVEAYLFAFGSPTPILPSTIRCLDEIITDFIIETCHEAAQCASYSRRSKIKVDDFKFVLRKDEKKLGRVAEILRLERELKNQRKGFEIEEDVKRAAEAGGSVADGDEEGPRRKRRKRDGEGEGGSVDARSVGEGSEATWEK
ncbi:MAG: Transcription initiation factor TFIID subunit 13 [Bogoriella megaspora]|nr:MAG: Transcription initiation factor TFIID subunit 13 [Bogoriella megaspora]